MKSYFILTAILAVGILRANERAPDKPSGPTWMWSGYHREGSVELFSLERMVDGRKESSDWLRIGNRTADGLNLEKCVNGKVLVLRNGDRSYELRLRDAHIVEGRSGPLSTIPAGPVTGSFIAMSSSGNVEIPNFELKPGEPKVIDLGNGTALEITMNPRKDGNVEYVSKIQHTVDGKKVEDDNPAVIAPPDVEFMLSVDAQVISYAPKKSSMTVKTPAQVK